MGSRIRDKSKKVFEVFTEIARPATSKDEPFVLQIFPQEFDDEDVMKSIPKFAFPITDCESAAVDHFTFVLTDLEGKFKFGFCRHASGAQTCLSIVSYFPWYEIFYKLLNALAETLNKTENNSVDNLLAALLKQEVPEPGQLVEAITPSLTDKFSFHIPIPNELPRIPENRNLTEYYNAIDSTNMMIIFASLIFERRIIVTSKKLSRLTACVHGAAALLYPMHWQHLYIPVLPHHLLDYLSAPMPFLIGVHSSLMEKAKMQELGDAIILNADTNTITTEYDDLATLPQDAVSSLKRRLKAQQSEKSLNSLYGDGLARAFLKCLVSVIGGYRDGLRFRPEEQITFDPDAFVQSRPPNMQPFLEQLLHLQIFQQFIEERLFQLNSGEGFSDEFEMEANMQADKWGAKSRYQGWLTDMKRQGKKWKQGGKDRWVEFTGRANPAMRHAVQRFRDKSKKAVKDIRSKFDDKKELDEHGRRTIPSNSLYTQRPPRPPPPNLDETVEEETIPVQKQSIIRRTSYERARHYKTLEIAEDPGSTTDAAVSVHRRRTLRTIDDSELLGAGPQRISVDLLHDPDILNIFKKSYSVEDVTLQDTDESDVEQGVDAMVFTEVEPVSSTPVHSTPVHSTQVRKSTASTSEPVPGLHSTSSMPILDLSKQPVPAPRAKRQTLYEPLINLSANSSQMSQPAHIEFDPLHDPSSVVNRPDGSSRSATSLEVERVCANPVNHNAASDNQIAHPVPRPRNSLARTNAFNRKSTSSRISPTSQAMDAQSITEARSVFIQSDMTKTSLDVSDVGLDLFDPLVTGQLEVDSPSPTPNASSTGKQQEENLLKEWNIDFNKMRSAPPRNVSAAPPPIPPKPVLPSHLRSSLTNQSNIYSKPAASYHQSVYSHMTTGKHLQYSPVHRPYSASTCSASPTYSPTSASPIVSLQSSPAQLGPTQRQQTPSPQPSQDPFSDVLIQASQAAEQMPHRVPSPRGAWETFD